MNLTYGNIKKSKILKYIYLDLPENEYHSALVRYEEELRHKFSENFVNLRSNFHDSKIEIKNNDNNITLVISINKDEKKKVILNFHNGRIVAWNKIKTNGHISKLNKKVEISEYGYEEFYEDKNINYVSIIFYIKNRKTVNIGTYYPYLTIKYDNMEVIEIA